MTDRIFRENFLAFSFFFFSFQNQVFLDMENKLSSVFLQCCHYWFFSFRRSNMRPCCSFFFTLDQHFHRRYSFVSRSFMLTYRRGAFFSFERRVHVSCIYCRASLVFSYISACFLFLFIFTFTKVVEIGARVGKRKGEREF